MSDAILRQLARRWHETKSIDDEVAYLRERVRAGDLVYEQLQLAAYCGNVAAGAVTGVCPGPSEIVDWLRGLRSMGRTSWVESILHSLKTLVLPWPDSPGRAALLRALATVEGVDSKDPPAGSAPPKDPEFPDWTREWTSPSWHSYRALCLAARRLLAESIGRWRPWADVSIPLAKGTQPVDAIAALTAAGALVDQGNDDQVLSLKETGIHVGRVVREIMLAGDLTPQGAARIAMQASLVLWVFEAWDNGLYDGRMAIAKLAGPHRHGP